MSSKNLFYNALYDDPRVANNMVGAVADNLNKFERYLDIAIKTMREKQQITARWDKVEDPVALQFEPLAYEIAIRTSSAIEVFLEENYLELNVTNDIPFDPSEGLKLDHNWVPLLPEQFEIHSLSTRRHVMKLNDWNDYKGERQATTKDGCTAEITPFKVTKLSQNGQELTVIGKSYEPARGCYRFMIEDDLDEEGDLSINGMYLEQNDWKVVTRRETPNSFVNEEGQPVLVKAVLGNTFYVDKSFPSPKTLLYDGLQTSFTIREVPIPKLIEHSEGSISVENFRGSYYTLGKTSFIEDGFIYPHPTLNIPLFRVTVNKERSPEKHRNFLSIRLRDESEEEEFFSKSPIDYFFDQDVEELEGIVDGRKVKVFIKESNPDERILYVTGEKSKNDRQRMQYSDIPEVLSIRVNTYQLEMQRRAIQRLKNQPLTEHIPLIRLSQKKSHQRIWPAGTAEEIQQWYVLYDNTRQGVQAQREFVQKAMATPDFALLEGPPGSGKTTTILELILQLVRKGKRIMLCGSTHVAIDNVLERLKQDDLMEGIFPLRIGSRDSVSPDIKEYCLEQYEGHKYSELMIESSNLVCATTVGILKHPAFQLAGDQPANPIYDYLIIDESSKTTFQEFLIPALFAKKWILVGDIKQLPPYSEREQIVAGIDDNTKLKPFLKKACLLIYQYIHNYKVRMPVCIVETEDVIQAIRRELAASRPEAIKKGIVVVDREAEAFSAAYMTITDDQLKNNEPLIWALSGANVLFVNEKLFENVERLIPNHMVVVKENWEHSSQHYQVNAYYEQRTKELHDVLKFTWKEDRNRYNKLPIDFLIEQKRFFKERSWASEYEWRMVRIFELQNVEHSNTKENYKRQLELLSPKTASQQGMRDIEVVRDVALPSILQSLQEGIGKNRDGSLDTTLNSGFEPEERRERFVTLDYQHRMHPDISKFPRKQFYQDTALQNSRHAITKREWSYTRYPARNIWLDVNGKMRRSWNDAEVAALIKELRLFVEWANQNKNEQNNRGRWEVACLSFYNKQREAIARALQDYIGGERNLAKFTIGNVDIKNYTVDKFQGQEADITFLSMVRTERGMGFLDNPNRLNVAITRARFQRVMIGKYQYFLSNDQSEQLKLIARESVYFTHK